MYFSQKVLPEICKTFGKWFLNLPENIFPNRDSEPRFGIVSFQVFSSQHRRAALRREPSVRAGPEGLVPSREGQIRGRRKSQIHPQALQTSYPSRCALQEFFFHFFLASEICHLYVVFSQKLTSWVSNDQPCECARCGAMLGFPLPRRNGLKKYGTENYT